MNPSERFVASLLQRQEAISHRRIGLRDPRKHMAGLWKDIVKGFEVTGLVEEGGVEMRQKQRDPSLRDQLYERRLDPYRSYLDACSKAPHASSGTKRKWKRALGL